MKLWQSLFLNKYKTVIREHRQKTLALISIPWPLWDRGSDWICLSDFFFFFFFLAMNKVLESCEEWHSLIIPLISPVPPHTETSQPVCCANHLTGFHVRATPSKVNGVKANVKQNETKELVVRSTYFLKLEI